MDGSIQKYMAFVKTVECGSFTKAAEQLSYSQYTSIAINRLIQTHRTLNCIHCKHDIFF